MAVMHTYQMMDTLHVVRKLGAECTELETRILPAGYKHEVRFLPVQKVRTIQVGCTVQTVHTVHVGYTVDEIRKIHVRCTVHVNCSFFGIP